MFKAFKHQYLLAAVVFMASSSAVAREISYDYIEGAYTSTTVSTSSMDIDGDGFSVVGSFSVTPNIAIEGGYGTVSFDRAFGVDVDATELYFGLTAHTSVAPGTDIFGNFSVLNGEFEASNGFSTYSTDDTGNVISIGLRHMLNNVAELNMSFSRVDIFDDASNAFNFGGRYHISNQFSLGAGFSTGDDVETLSLNARFNIK